MSTPGPFPGQAAGETTGQVSLKTRGVGVICAVVIFSYFILFFLVGCVVYSLKVVSLHRMSLFRFIFAALPAINKQMGWILGCRTERPVEDIELIRSVFIRAVDFARPSDATRFQFDDCHNPVQI